MILDSTAIHQNAARCPCCHGYDHLSVKECPFPDGEGGGGRQNICHRAGQGKNRSEIASTGDLSQL